MSQPLTSTTVRTVESARRSPIDVIKDYIAITKPKHQVVLLTCWATMTMAGGLPLSSLLFVLFATGLGVASSHVFNQLIDSDIDALMTRTRNRPLAAKRISRKISAAFGVILGILSVALTYWGVNLLAALLVVVGWGVYVLIYSLWLKRATPWGTLIGGVSGAVPTLIGWAAVTGRLDLAPLLLFTFMVIWQCPHFYALSLFREDEYRRAGIPAVVVVSGPLATLRQMLVYSVLMVASTLAVHATGATGTGYLVTALVGGGLYLAGVVAANLQGVEKAPLWGRRLFFSSYPYMAAIYISAALTATG